jgi:hypothetical protein
MSQKSPAEPKMRRAVAAPTRPRFSTHQRIVLFEGGIRLMDQYLRSRVRKTFDLSLSARDLCDSVGNGGLNIRTLRR